MKKLIALLLILTMVLSLAACGKREETAEPEDGNNPVAVESTPVEEAEPDPLSHEFTQYGNGKIKIVGAEFTQDDYGDDLLRIYYDYTNTDDTANGHYLNTALQFVSITQDGNECETYMADSDDYFIVPEDLNNTNYVQPGCTNRNTILIACDPNGGNVKVSCFLMIGGWVYNANEVEPFEFEIDTKDLMGAPEPFVLPAITNPTYTSGMSASGKYDYPLDSEISINDIELTKDYDGRDVIRVNLTVTNNGEEELTPALICLLELYQDGVSLPWVNATWDMDSDAVTDRDTAYEEDLYPGETVECSALFYPRTQSPVEAVIENVNAELCLGARFDLKPLYEEANAQAEVAAEAAAQAAAAASAADKAIMAAMVGAWDRTNSWPDHITFHADGTGVHDMTGDLFDFSYYVSEGVVYLTYDDGEETDYEVTVNGNDMILFNAFYQEEQTFARTGTAETEEPGETEPAQTEPAATEAAAMDWATFLIGTWEDQESGYYETFTFRADGTGMYSYYDGGLMEFPFTYEICDDDSVDIFYDDGDAGGFWMEAADENTLLISNSAVSDMPLIRE